MSIEIIGQSLPIIEEGDKIPELIEQETDYQEDDVLVISGTIVSRARGRTRKLEEVRVGEKAKQLSKENDKDPKICQLILDEASEIIATGEGFVITEINGLVCANAGIDLSNSKEGKAILKLKNPNKIAEEYSQKLGVGVIISDSVGRSFRKGAVGLAIGYSGLSPFSSYIGQKDLFGREMETTKECVADELASAANLVLGESNQGKPIAIIKGFGYNGEPEEAKINRKSEESVFR